MGFVFRGEDNISAFLEALEDAVKRLNENKQRMLKEVCISRERMFIYSVMFIHLFIVTFKLESDASNRKLYDERYVNIFVDDEKFEIAPSQKDQLYCEIIYTIKHKIGRTIDGHNDYILDLYKYAKEAFKMSPQDHERLFALTCEEKVNIIKFKIFILYFRNFE